MFFLKMKKRRKINRFGSKIHLNAKEHIEFSPKNFDSVYELKVRLSSERRLYPGEHDKNVEQLMLGTEDLGHRKESMRITEDTFDSRNTKL